MKKKVLFITPSLDRTGSEMLLWYLINNLDPDKFESYVFSLRKGELFHQLPNGVGKSTAYRVGKWYLKAFRGVLKLFGTEPIGYQLKQIQKRFKADLWYANTILIPQAPLAAKAVGVKMTTHFHEFMYAYGFIKSGAFRDIVEHSDVLVGCSPLVCEKLTGLGHPKVLLQHSFIDPQKIRTDAKRVNALRQQHGIAENDFVWLISGAMAYMKGLDLVLAIAQHFKNKPVKLIWVGADLHNGLDYYVKTVATKQNWQHLVFTGAVSADYYNYFELANAYLSLSREECLSLAMLEAATLGKPIVSFNTGIAKSFVREGMGLVVDGFNVADMIKAMETFWQDPSYNAELLKEAAAIYTAERQLPNFEKLLTKI